MNIELSTGVTLYVRDHGTNGHSPTYLFIHGWAVSGAIWDPVVRGWPEDGCRLLIPDLRGTGFSSKPREGYTLDAYTADIIEVIDRLDLSDFILVGHSMGGTIAQRVALERQDRLRSLVLVSPVPASGVALEPEQVAFFRSLGGHRAGAEQVLSMVMANVPPAAEFETMVRDVATVCIEAFWGGLDSWRSASFGDRLGELQVPTLVVGGSAEQPLTPDLLVKTVVEPIPDARFELLEGSGHYPQYEATDSLIALLRGAA